jgi:TPP-dependent trihydroxycyclohexane-1,2-dione (THcHDO) dehydratase
MATRQQLNPPPLRKITDFKSKLTGGGARPNLFEVVLSFPDAAAPDATVLDKARFLVKAANLPASNVWWDVAPAEVSTQPWVAAIRTDYEAGLSTQRWHA